MSSTALKIIAVICMLIDHTGAILFPQYEILRVIGRLAFPIYCFLLTEGIVHTSNWKKYIGRLLLLAVVSEIPFDLGLFHIWRNPWYQNVFWTLAAGAAACELQKKLTEMTADFAADKEKSGASLMKPALYALGILAVVGLCEVLHTDYGGKGVLLMWILYLVKKADFKTGKWGFSALSIACCCILLYGGIESYGSLAAVPILLYNKKRGWCPKPVQWGFYWFYPVHLFLLALLAGSL